MVALFARRIAVYPGDGLGELEVLIGLTDLPGGTARCLAAA